MNIVAKTGAVVLAVAALCGLGVGTAAAATSDQVIVSSTTSCTDLTNHWTAVVTEDKAEIDALIVKMREERESDPAQYEADFITYQALFAQYNEDLEILYGVAAKCS